MILKLEDGLNFLWRDEACGYFWMIQTVRKILHSKSFVERYHCDSKDAAC